MVFIAVGDFSRSDMERKVREVFQELKSSDRLLPSREAEPEPQETQFVVSYGNFKETYLQLAVPITSATDDDTPALDALSHILGGGEASRLVQRVKLEKRLVHSISSSSFTPRDRGAFIIGATLPPENVKKAIEETLAILDDLSKEGVTAEELYRVKVNVESDLVYDRQTVQGQARKRGFYEAITGDIDFEKEYLRRMAIVEREDVQRVIQKYFKTPRWVVSVLAPTEQKDLLSSGSLAGVIRGVASPEKTLDQGEGPPIFRTVLGNGIRLLVKENRSTPVVSIQAAFLGGVRFETESNNGINQFIAVMLTKGTQSLTSLQIAKKMERMAGSLSGFSGYNSFGLTGTFLSQHFEEAFGLFAEVLKAPSFDKEEMEKRRQSILAAIRQQEDDLDRSVFRLFRKTLYQRHPYRMDPLGTLETVQSLTQKELREYYDRMAVPENLVLTVVGDVDTGQVLQAVQNMLGELKGTLSRPPVAQESLPQGIRKKEIYSQKEQAHFVLGFLGPTLHHRDRYAAEVLDAALSGQGGRLFYELRDQESLAYALTFMANPNFDPGFIAVYMGTHPDKLEKAIQGALRILKSVKNDGLTEEEVERAKRYLIGNFEIGLQTNGAQAGQISLDELYGLGFDHYEKYTKAIERVSREDVQRVAREYLRLDAYVLAVLRPPEKKP
jgi:zinc protease